MAVESIMIVDEVLETVDCLERDVFTVFKDITERLKDLETVYKKIFDQDLATNELIQATERQIEHEYDKLKLFETKTSENKANIENFKVTIHELGVLKNKRDMERSKLEREVAALRNKIDAVQEKKETMTRRKDVILAYKLLTKVDFVYSTKKVKGLVNKEATKPFILDPQELSQEEITRKLWDIIRE